MIIVRNSLIVFIAIILLCGAQITSGGGGTDLGGGLGNGDLGGAKTDPPDATAEWSGTDPKSSSETISSSKGSGANYSSTLVALGEFGFAYEFTNSNGDLDIGFRVINQNQVLSPNSELVVCSSAGNQRKPTCSFGSGKVGIVWQETKNVGGNNIISLFYNSVELSTFSPGFTSAIQLDLGQGADSLSNPKLFYSDETGVFSLLYEQTSGLIRWIKLAQLSIKGTVLSGSMFDVCSINSDKQDIKISKLDVSADPYFDLLLVTWKDNRNGNWDIYTQAVDISSSKTENYNGWPQEGIQVSSNPAEQRLSVITGAMNFDELICYVAYEDKQDGNWDVKVNKINSSGSLEWDQDGKNVYPGNSQDQQTPSISCADSSRVVVVFEHKAAAPAGSDILACIFDESGNQVGGVKEDEFGNPLPPSPIFLCAENQDQLNPSSVFVGTNYVFIAWEDNRNSIQNGSDIYAQRIDISTGQSGWLYGGRQVCTKSQNQKFPKVYADTNEFGLSGDALIAFQDFNIVANSGLSAQIVTLNGALHRPNKPAGFNGLIDFDMKSLQIKGLKLNWIDSSIIEDQFVIESSFNSSGTFSVFITGDGSNIMTANKPVDGLDFGSYNLFAAYYSALEGYVSKSPPSGQIIFYYYAAPTDVKTESVSESKIKVSFKWSSSGGTNPPGFKIVRKNQQNTAGPFVEIATVSFISGKLSSGSYSFSFTDNNLVQDKSYEYSVRAFNGTIGTSEFSGIVLGNTKPDSSGDDDSHDDPDEGDHVGDSDHGNDNGGDSESPEETSPPVDILTDASEQNDKDLDALTSKGKSAADTLCYIATSSCKKVGDSLVTRLNTFRSKYLIRQVFGSNCSSVYSKTSCKISLLLARENMAVFQTITHYIDSSGVCIVLFVVLCVFLRFREEVL
ncbi:MAG: fibronectin type III domain-containing protein [Planctomycetes bacterium]|nr:fibronectin type III domain-containing protein [Planctomycetota bacterium]